MSRHLLTTGSIQSIPQNPTVAWLAHYWLLDDAAAELEAETSIVLVAFWWHNGRVENGKQGPRRELPELVESSAEEEAVNLPFQISKVQDHKLVARGLIVVFSLLGRLVRLGVGVRVGFGGERDAAGDARHRRVWRETGGRSVGLEFGIVSDDDIGIGDDLVQLDFEEWGDEGCGEV